MDHSERLQFIERDNLSPEERMNIRESLQTMLLSAIAAQFPLGEIIHHGGNGLHFGMESPRHSEDLDFYLKDETWKQDLAARLNTVVSDVHAQLQEIDEDHNTQIKPPKALRDGPDGEARTAAYTFRWEHPKRTGAIKIKMEFCKASSIFLNNYPTHSKNGLMHQALLGAWADKIVALGKRTYKKRRDLFDLDWVSKRLSASDDEKMDALEAVSAVYGFDIDEVLEGLAGRIEASEFHDTAEFAKEMKDWFRSEDYRIFDFQEVMEDGRAEMRSTIELCARMRMQP